MKKSFLTLLLLVSPVLAGPLDEARGMLAEGRHGEARPLLERALENDALRAQALVLLTRLCNDIEEYKQGIEYGEAAVKALPDSSEAHYQYALALRIKMQNVNQFKAMFIVGDYKDELNRAIELDPGHLDALEERIGFLLNAPGIAGGDKKQAGKEIQSMKQLDWRRGTRLDAQIEAQHGEPGRTIELYESLLEKDAADTASRNELAFFLQQSEHYAEADEQFAVLAQAERRNISLSALYQRAKTRVLGKYEQDRAIEFLTRYVEQLPEDAPGLPDESAARWRMGMAYEQLGQTGAARRSYELSVKLNPEFEQAKQSLTALK